MSKNKPPEGDVKPEDVEYCENGFKKLQGDDNCHSLLKKHLTQNVLDDLKNKKTSTFNSTMRDVIQSGVENLDSGIGVYAPDAEAYVVFAALFDPIIEEYHGGFSKDKVHPPSDLGDPSVFGDLDPEKKYDKLIFRCASSNICYCTINNV